MGVIAGHYPGAVTDEAPGGRRSRLGQALREVDRRESLLRTARFVRRLAPGDSEMGDPLSTAGRLPSHRLARALAGNPEPSVLRELGLTAVQVWQAFTDSRRATETAGITILFTDLVGFSTWALEAGDDAALRLLREVGRVSEPEITRRGGRVVKRLGDGLMAVFAEPEAGVEAAIEACARVAELEISGHRPSLRAGLHAGTPRKLGHDTNRRTCTGVAHAAKVRPMSCSARTIGSPSGGGCHGFSSARCACPAITRNSCGERANSPESHRASSNAKPQYTQCAAASTFSVIPSGAKRA